MSLDSNLNDITNTYPIAIGNKGDNHNSVELLYLEGLDDLSNGRNSGFFSLFLQKIFKVQLEVIVALGDQPERRSVNYLMNCNST